ncbi:tetratricopeptide repeat protein [Candidatus Heimdallarchaeota archaeon]|nr:MAG: tetratricopeptide repeat protein [Candidatus Heimdallarchaeota archaeon]
MMAANANIAEFYQLMGEYQTALPYALKAKEISNKVGLREIEILLSLVTIYAELKDFQKADPLLHRAQEIVDKSDSQYLQGSLMVAKATTEFKRLNFAIAENLFKKAIALVKKLQIMELEMTASVLLAELLLSKQIIDPSDKNEKEAFSLLQKMQNIASDRGLNRFNAEMTIIQGLLKASNYNFRESKTFLSEAITLAKDYRLQSLLEKAKKELERVILLEESAADLDQKEININYLQEASSYLKRTLRFSSMMGFSKEQQPHSLLILSENGLLLHSHYFNDSLEFDDLIASGFISAISAFGEKLFKVKSSDESEFGQDSKLRSITHGKFTIMLESSSKYIFALIVESENPKTRKQLRQFTQQTKDLTIDPNSSTFEKDTLPEIKKRIKRCFI